LHISYALYILHNLLLLCDDEVEDPGSELLSIEVLTKVEVTWMRWVSGGGMYCQSN